MGSSDRELLAEFVKSGSQSAFAEIVRRHGQLVRAAALRQVRRSHLADDVMQAVFIVLARRAATVPGEFLPAWLLRTTRYCCRDALKMEGRRQRHERQAASQRPAATSPPDRRLQQIADCLDAALSHLRIKERNAVALRFFESKSTAEVAQAMGITTDAAQKIIARSLVKLRRLLTSRGVTLPSAALVGQALGHFAGGDASPANAGSVAAAAVGQGASPSSLAIARGAGRLMAWAKGAWLTAAGALTLAAGLLLAYAFVTPVRAAAPLTQPFATPFLELVGCRIKQRITLDQAAPGGPVPPVTVTEHQYFQFEWKGAPPNAPTADAYDLVVTRVGAGVAEPPLWRITGVPVAVSAVAYGEMPDGAQAVAVMSQPAPLVPGDYVVELFAHVNGAQQPVRAASSRFRVAPYPPETHIAFGDVQLDGMIHFVNIVQDIHRGDGALASLNFINPESLPVGSVRDDRGNPMRVVETRQGDAVQSEFFFPRPIGPGEPVMVSLATQIRGRIETNPDQSITLRADLKHDSGQPARQMSVLRLPHGATVISTSPADLPRRVVDGQTQIFVDVVIPPSVRVPVAIRYELSR